MRARVHERKGGREPVGRLFCLFLLFRLRRFRFRNTAGARGEGEGRGQWAVVDGAKGRAAPIPPTTKLLCAFAFLLSFKVVDHPEYLGIDFVLSLSSFLPHFILISHLRLRHRLLHTTCYLLHTSYYCCDQHLHFRQRLLCTPAKHPSTTLNLDHRLQPKDAPFSRTHNLNSNSATTSAGIPRPP